ncbi:mitochondrial import receptor subunit Tom22p [Trichomonascus vanleenenianus]|uniref:Tom22p n=1 Tax=Trichomonascus vanleenenianus TaxID=2268995 RepID=UPI003EC9EDE1
MVRVTPVSEENPERAFEDEKLAAENDADYTDTESELSEEEYDEDEDLEAESIADRIIALRDVIPPQYRSKISSTAASLYDTAQTGISWSGKALWVTMTSALLLGVPLALSIVSEQQLTEMEKEMKLTQSTNEVLAPGAEGGFQAPPATPQA